MQRFLAKFIPFVFLGVMIVALVFGIILFSYLLILGAVVGMVLFVIQWIRNRFFQPRYPTTFKHQSRSGRTFDHQD